MDPSPLRNAVARNDSIRFGLSQMDWNAGAETQCLLQSCLNIREAVQVLKAGCAITPPAVDLRHNHLQLRRIHRQEVDGECQIYCWIREGPQNSCDHLRGISAWGSIGFIVLGFSLFRVYGLNPKPQSLNP